MRVGEEGGGGALGKVKGTHSSPADSKFLPHLSAESACEVLLERYTQSSACGGTGSSVGALARCASPGRGPLTVCRIAGQEGARGGKRGGWGGRRRCV